MMKKFADTVTELPTPAPRETAVQAMYRQQARIYDATRWMFLHGRSAAVDCLALTPGDSVLEVGCGTGLNLSRLARCVGPEGQVVGVDFSPAMLARARQRIGRHQLAQVLLVEQDAARLRIETAFHAALFSYSITMIPDWPAALSRVADHLRPGGRVVVLDFGRFEGWPTPAQRFAQWVLNLHHVRTDLAVEQALNERFVEVRMTSHRGGYYFIASGARPMG